MLGYTWIKVSGGSSRACPSPGLWKSTCGQSHCAGMDGKSLPTLLSRPAASPVRSTAGTERLEPKDSQGSPLHLLPDPPALELSRAEPQIFASCHFRALSFPPEGCLWDREDEKAKVLEVLKAPKRLIALPRRTATPSQAALAEREGRLGRSVLDDCMKLFGTEKKLIRNHFLINRIIMPFCS